MQRMKIYRQRGISEGLVKRIGETFAASIIFAPTPITVLIFPENFLNFRLDMTEKQRIINLCSYNIVVPQL